jgi:hypothetical protein
MKNSKSRRCEYNHTKHNYFLIGEDSVKALVVEKGFVNRSATRSNLRILSRSGHVFSCRYTALWKILSTILFCGQAEQMVVTYQY